MIGLLLSALAFLAVGWSTRRSLGHGLGVALAVGYFYGIVRANVLDGGTHFLFDAALAGLYLGAFTGRPQAGRRPPETGAVRLWVLALIAWPALLLVVPSQHVLVQLVGLRAAAWFLPCVLLGARVGPDDKLQVARWLAGLNLVALAFGGLEFLLGVERFYPPNAVTEIIYKSSDAGQDGALRIPAVFANAHAYGGTMVASLPLVLGGWTEARTYRERALFLAATFAAAVGVFLCAARQPVVYLFGLATVFLLTLPLSSRRRATALLLIGLVAAVVGTSERLQRYSSLTDPETVANRVQGSINMSFVELLLDHPMGEGLASAAGTSIPYFLEHLAKPQIGLENEWGRIAIEQSLVGLLLWAGFVAATLRRYPRGHAPWLLAGRLMWALTGMLWATAFIGTGMLTSIPGSVVLLLYMGALWGAPAVSPRRRRRRAPDPLESRVGESATPPQAVAP